MKTMTDSNERLHYFNHQFLRAEDFTAEQEYHLGRRRLHNRLLHTWGIATGLEVTHQAGAAAVTVRQGVAVDEEGREIALAVDRAIDLSSFPSDAAVFVTIAYDERQTGATDETGIEGNTRWTEAPLVEASASTPPNPGQKLILARATRSGTEVTGVDGSQRRAAGVVGGDLEVRSLALTDPNVVPTRWPRLRLGAADRADLQGNLGVSGDLTAGGTLRGNLASNAVGTGQLADGAVTAAKVAPGAIDAIHLRDQSVGTSKLADNAVSGPKIANATINEVKLDAATRARLVTGGDSHDHAGGDGAQIRHSTLAKDDGRNPHGTTAADVGALPVTGGTVAGDLSVSNGSVVLGTPAGASNHIAFGRPEGKNISVFISAQPQPNVSAGISAALMVWPVTNGVQGVNLISAQNADTLVVSGTARFTGNKIGYVTDTFINGSGETLRTGDVVKLKSTGTVRFQGDSNRIPVAEVSLADREVDPLVIGIVDGEATPAPGEPDNRTEPGDPTSIAPGGDLFVVTLGTYAHCKADATEAPIEVGDLLTTSARPGHAKKAVDPKVGSIIGKALDALSEGTGYISVFVNIQ
jgi:hypothetical protein